jgi:ferritin
LITWHGKEWTREEAVERLEQERRRLQYINPPGAAVRLPEREAASLQAIRSLSEAIARHETQEGDP